MKFSSMFEIVLIICILVVLGKIYFSIFGKFFKLYVNDIKKRLNMNSNYVYFCYPHTSYYDGFFSVSSSLLLSIFSPQTPLFPIAKHHNIPSFIKKYTFLVGSDKNQTKKLIDTIKKNNNCSLYIAPEGTRSKKDKIRKGFYYIAKKTKLPIVCSTINFSTMETHYSQPITVENRSINQVFNDIKKWYKQFDLDKHSVNPENRTPLKI
ncbi:hypothetical protein CPAV1605_934 [seawater metagenome]|uniref:Phospholipid/glycerol acyltransferase domain-containing protein n=1 Tax=seawater metagenome TaxID=1561972 RepID=A0A5E8CKJ9_9ZZZZ